MSEHQRWFWRMKNNDRLSAMANWRSKIVIHRLRHSANPAVREFFEQMNYRLQFRTMRQEPRP